jgi:signal peptidase I
MSTITAFILAGFVAYAGAWYAGVIEGSFALLLLMASTVTGVYWLAEQLHFMPRRRAAAVLFDADRAQRLQALAAQGITSQEDDTPALQAREALLRQPWWLDWTAGLFPVIAAVFFLRSFLFEPFKIPSGSMIPTLHIGDLILVNKFHYGIRLPVLNVKILDNNPVERGDVMVFRYPPKPSLDYIKRVVGVPGDKIAYINKVLTINGQLVSKVSVPEFFDADTMRYSKQFEEAMPTTGCPILSVASMILNSRKTAATTLKGWSAPYPKATISQWATTATTLLIRAIGGLCLTKTSLAKPFSSG